MKDTDAGRWFMYDSKTWKQDATEFVCQGMDLDFPLVALVEIRARKGMAIYVPEEMGETYYMLMRIGIAEI